MKHNTKINYQKITDDMVNGKSVFGSIFHVEHKDETISSLTSSGNLTHHDYYFIASVSKLYVTAMVFILKNIGKLTLNDPMVSFFKPKTLDGLHVLNNIDYTNQITIRHLLSNQTGLKDYFYYEDTGSKAVTHLNQHDVYWTFDKMVERVKTLKPYFKPGQAKKVNYSDTNFKILGEIIEIVTNMPIHQAFEHYLFKPLGLKASFVFQESSQEKIAPLYYKKQILIAPKYMSSIGAEGGVVAKASDVMAFMKAFFNGFYFPIEDLNEIKQNYRMIFFPGQFYFGTGIEKLWIPRILSYKHPINNLIGFWGQTGAYAFYDEDTKLFFTGTINQASGFGHGKALRGIIKVIKTYRKDLEKNHV